MTFRSNARISSPKHAKFAIFLERREYQTLPSESFDPHTIGMRILLRLKIVGKVLPYFTELCIPNEVVLTDGIFTKM
jgi:hypothetical protein